MLTGTLPLSHGGLGPLSEDRPRVAQNLNEAGLTTGGFQSNPFLSRHFNYDVGFDTYEDYQNPLMGVATKIFPRGIELNNPKLRKVDDIINLTDLIKKSYKLVKGKPRPYVSAETISDDTIEWLDQVDEPFFGWAHYMDVHHPCFPPETYREQFDVEDVSQTDVSEWYSKLLTEPETLSDHEIDALRCLYDAAVVYTDDQVNRLTEKLEEKGYYEDTMVVFTSDHGELFGEHEGYGKPERMHDELLRVPLIVANGPERLRDHSKKMVSLLDLPILFHDALGLDIPEEYTGQTFANRSERDVIVAEHEVDGDVIVGGRSGEYLFEGDQIRDENRLFDQRNGTTEQIDGDADEGNEVREVVLTRLDDLDIDARQLEDQVEGDVQDRLEDLGY
ncbi:MAG: sulfatase-like hydrolase/transferase, partial [Halobacteriaceae archaeon]